MSTGKTSFMDSMLYPILFMLLITLLFVGVLAAMYRGSQNRINTQAQEAYERTVLDLCAQKIASESGASVEAVKSAYPGSYRDYIQKVGLKGVDRAAYKAVVNEKTVSWIVDIPGRGLWGSMRALVALSPDLTSIMDINIYEQMETPGLGARIGEEWFRKQFSDKPVIVNGSPVQFEQIPEKQAPETPYQIKKVTGASITTGAVISMLKTELTKIYNANPGVGQ